MRLNIHIHPVTLDHASRVLKSLASAGRSGCFSQRAFFGSGSDNLYALKDEVGVVDVRTVPRECGPYSSFLRKSVATVRWSRHVETMARKLPAKCINVHGLSTLLLGVKLKRFLRCKLIYDTHELETKALAIRGVRRVYSELLERSLIRFCDGVICVSDGIADWYASRYGIHRPTVVRNIPDKRSKTPGKAAPNLRARFGVPASGLLFVYLGRISSDRQIKQFLEVFRSLPADYHMVMIGNGELEHEVRRESKARSNIHHMSAVPPEEVISCAGEADVGLVGVENRCLSYYLSLPNKLFESLAAGIPVIAPDFPEIRRVLETYQCGWLWSGNGVVLRSLIESLTREKIKAKRRGALDAGSRLSWEQEEQGLFKLYQALFK